ncbi:hypothetical protein HanPSC8_Chr07g0306291 [Helianthus annuus]|nr:hypothetical protein HanPSC8_Chr07g0306291 [Helianthus annuus]
MNDCMISSDSECHSLVSGRAGIVLKCDIPGYETGTGCSYAV